jgi:hypothetical protein
MLQKRRLMNKKSRLRAALRTQPWIMALCLAGCQGAPQPPTAAEKIVAESDKLADEARGVADASMGKQSEILAQGDLALNGREQLLVVNRFASAESANQRNSSASPLLVRRAAVLEKNNGNWSQIFLCDEHLKNINGYLGGLPRARIEGWQLAFSTSATHALEMSFTPSNRVDVENASADGAPNENKTTFNVRWNKNLKRYQSFDQSHERYLGEVPALEAPESTLK